MGPIRILTGACVVILAQACANHQTSPEVTAQMARTEAVLQQADRSGVARDSLADLQLAKDKFARARTAVERQSRDGDREALRLAQQAEVDAQYASASAEATRQEQSAREVRRGLETLEREASRDTTTPAAPVTRGNP